MEIITGSRLATYLGVAVDDKLNYLAELANGLVEAEWRNPVDPAPAWVVTIALEAAARPARNPRGLGSVTRSIDDGSRTERYSETAARAGVYLLDAELRRLQQLPTTSRSGRVAGTIRAKVPWR